MTDLIALIFILALASAMFTAAAFFAVVIILEWVWMVNRKQTKEQNND